MLPNLPLWDQGGAPPAPAPAVRPPKLPAPDLTPRPCDAISVPSRSPGSFYAVSPASRVLRHQQLDGGKPPSQETLVSHRNPLLRSTRLCGDAGGIEAHPCRRRSCRRPATEPPSQLHINHLAFLRSLHVECLCGRPEDNDGHADHSDQERQFGNRVQRSTKFLAVYQYCC